jgi:hypothetical protein
MSRKPRIGIGLVKLFLFLFLFLKDYKWTVISGCTAFHCCRRRRYVDAERFIAKTRSYNHSRPIDS